MTVQTELRPLAQPLQITPTCRLKNRILKAAMSEQLADKSQAPTEQLSSLYAVWAQGGAGLLITGNVMIDRRALGEPRNVVLDALSDLKPFKRWAAAATQNETQVWMQLNHPGKQVPRFLSAQPVAPSSVPLGTGLEKAFATPRALTEDEIAELIRRFAWAAGTAKACGFTGVQIHAAHGYLINQFLSPHHNRRNDHWGGSLENRMRFLREVYKAVRAAVGNDFPVAVKLNSADFQKSGFDESDSMRVLETLQADGVDLVEISGGNYENPQMVGDQVRESTRKREAYFIEYAERAAQQLQMPLAVTGGFRSALAMNEALQQGAASLIGLARPLAVDPNYPTKLISNAEQTLEIKRPTTGFKLLDRFMMLDITWFEQQLARIATGKQPEPGLSPWRVILSTLLAIGSQAFAKRRY